MKLNTANLNRSLKRATPFNYAMGMRDVVIKHAVGGGKWIR